MPTNLMLPSILNLIFSNGFCPNEGFTEIIATGCFASFLINYSAIVVNLRRICLLQKYRKEKLLSQFHCHFGS